MDCTEQACFETDFLTFTPGELQFTVEQEELFLGYKKLEFMKYGKITRDFCINGNFYDSILMEYEID